MKKLLFISSTLLFGCNQSELEEGTVSENIILEYNISYENLSSRLVVADELDPFSDGLVQLEGVAGDTPVVELFRNAGVSISQEVYMKYDWPQKLLVVDANQDLHKIIESKLGTKGEIIKK